MSAALQRGIALGRSLYWRFYQDYAMPSRLPEFARLLTLANEHGYRVISVEQWAALLANPDFDPNSAGTQRLLVNRHDVDTDAALTLPWSQIELDHGAGASYFYRQSTMNDRCIRTVMDRGFHVSYHFEELADVAKERGILKAADLAPLMPEIRQRFAVNLAALRKRFGWSAAIVCSHGDWMNRRLGVLNHALLKDPQFRREIGVTHETYDADLMSPMKGYYTDTEPPKYWRKSGSPFDAIRAGLSPIGVLTHPRQWQSSLRCNTAETMRRITEGLAYKRHEGRSA